MNIKKKYILINSENLLIPTWLKVVIFFALNALFANIMIFIANSIANVFAIETYKVFRVTWFTNIFVLLALVYDLIPKFKKTIAITLSVFYFFVYLGISDPFYIGPMILIFFLIFINITFNKKVNKNQVEVNE